MRRKDEFFYRMHDEFVRDDCVNIMLGHNNKMLLFGNNDLMYSKDESINAYMNDDRRYLFPYSDVLSYKERINPLIKLNFTNQILDIEKPYIKVNDNLISKITVHKDEKGAIVHTKVLNGKFNKNYKSKLVNREELEKYLENGTIAGDEYIKSYVFDIDSNTYNKELTEEKVWIDNEITRLKNIILDNQQYDERTTLHMIDAVNNIKDIEPFFCIEKKIMIKFKENGEMVLEPFAVKYLSHDNYEILTTSMPITKETLSMIKNTVDLSKIKTTKAPKIKKLTK